MTVLILTRSDDNECVVNVTRAVEARGGSVFRVDTDLFPTELRLGVLLRPRGGAARWLERRNGSELERVDLDRVTAVWHRRLHFAAAIPPDMDPDLRDAARKESRRALLGTVGSLDAFVLDPEPRLRRAENKELQLRLAAAAGLETPRTLITNDPDAVRAFAADCEAGIVAKMLSSFAVRDAEGRESVVFTTPIAPADLEDLDGLRYSPTTFQERVPKRLELRVTVVGERVFAASIDSASRAGAEVDWRRKGLELALDWQPFDLPEGVRQRILALMDALGLNYGALDVVLTPDERFVFLEVNPAGEFFWLERAPGLAISDALADVLLGRAPRRGNGLGERREGPTPA
jgi:glutathione synthase/RimK-type ligase-like ATP-grasp enzyme